MTARVLVADPPWRFDDKLPGKGRGAVKHYSCLSLAEIKAFPLPPLADDCLLLLWRVAAMQGEALAVARAWGFTVKSELVWVKTTQPVRRAYDAVGVDTGGVAVHLAFGMGRYVRGAHEVCLVATRGRFQVADKSVRSVFHAPLGRHSEKPDRFYEIAEQLGGAGPYVELFARRQRSGWTCLGDEINRGTAPRRAT